MGKPTAEQQAAYDLYIKALLATIVKVKDGADMVDLEETMHGISSRPPAMARIFSAPSSME